MCFCSETEKVHFYLSSEHDAPMCSKLKQCNKQMCSRIGDTSAAGENVEIFTSDTACGVAEQAMLAMCAIKLRIERQWKIINGNSDENFKVYKR